jgi:hypothetical protein
LNTRCLWVKGNFGIQGIVYYFQNIMLLINLANRLPSKVDCLRHISWQKTTSTVAVLEVGTKQSRQANKAGRPTKQAGQQGRQANKAGRPTKQAGQQGRQANKAGGPTRQAGQQGRQANEAGGPTRQAGQ